MSAECYAHWALRNRRSAREASTAFRASCEVETPDLPPQFAPLPVAEARSCGPSSRCDSIPDRLAMVEVRNGRKRITRRQSVPPTDELTTQPPAARTSAMVTPRWLGWRLAPTDRSDWAKPVPDLQATPARIQLPGPEPRFRGPKGN